MEIQKQSVLSLLEGFRSGEMRIADIAAQTSAAIEAHKDLNAVIASNAKLLIENATALDARLANTEALPLHGIPVLLKDNIDTCDFPTTAATSALARHQPAHDAGAVTRLKKAGALIVGKANMHELAFGITSNNACTGAVRNPYNKDLIPGGSSGGSAAAVSAGIVPLALGSDTGGSNRIPAALCGICGFRPTTGRYPGDGLVNLSKTRDTLGVFARHVSDIILCDKVLADNSKTVSTDITQLRLGIPRDPFYKALEKQTAEVIERALEKIAAAGATLVEVDMPELFALNDKISFPIALFETLRELSSYLQLNKPEIGLSELTAVIASADVKHVMEATQGEQKIPEAVYLDALNVQRPLLKKMYADYFSDNDIDAMLYPTCPLTARPVGEDETVEINGRRFATFPSYVRNGDPASNADIPSFSMPAGLSADGLPVGLSIDGPTLSDDKVLAIGLALETLLPPLQGPAL